MSGRPHCDDRSADQCTDPASLQPPDEPLEHRREGRLRFVPVYEVVYENLENLDSEPTEDEIFLEHMTCILSREVVYFLKMFVFGESAAKGMLVPVQTLACSRFRRQKTND